MASYIKTPSGDLVLVMTKSEARGLKVLAGEGAEGILNDAESARTFIGKAPQVNAARRALLALDNLCVEDGSLTGGST